MVRTRTAGSPTLIVRKLMAPQTHLPTAYHGTSLAYNYQGEVGMMIERTWTESAGGGPNCESETLGRGIEFLGNGRTRYGVRQREFVEDPFGFWYWSIVEGTTLWSDHDGEEVYGDYTVTATKTWDEQEQVWVYGPPELHNVAAYLPGVGWMRTDPATSETTVYYAHSDHLGTLRLVSDQQSAISGVMVLTAFGEAVCGESAQNPCGTGVPPVGTRYQYAGDWGYESGLGSPGHGGAAGQPALPWQHVGHRWYDPSTGRFLQRDPIGIFGAVNVYAYAGNVPTLLVDPEGKLCLPLILIGAVIIALDWAAQYANAPELGGPVLSGGGGPSGASVIGVGCVGLGAGLAVAGAGGLVGDDSHPPGWTEDWENRGGTRYDPRHPNRPAKSWWDPDGGEWNYHPEDENHNPHWDHNPWDEWNDRWRQVPIPPYPPLK